MVVVVVVVVVEERVEVVVAAVAARVVDVDVWVVEASVVASVTIFSLIDCVVEV